MTFLVAQISAFMRFFFRTPVPLLLLVVSLGAGYTYHRFVDRIPEVKYVAVNGDLTEIQKTKVYERIAAMDLKNVEIKKVRLTLSEIDWIAETNVERQWPDSLIVEVIPEVAVALWNENDYINDKGRIFNTKYLQPGRLPQLSGPHGTELEVISQYRRISSLMLREGKAIASLSVDDRGAWTVQNSDGIDILLGKDDVIDRVQKMLLVTKQIQRAGRSEEIERVDTRYTNGVAIRWQAAESVVASRE